MKLFYHVIKNNQIYKLRIFNLQSSTLRPFQEESEKIRRGIQINLENNLDQRRERISILRRDKRSMRKNMIRKKIIIGISTKASILSKILKR